MAVYGSGQGAVLRRKGKAYPGWRSKQDAWFPSTGLPLISKELREAAHFFISKHKMIVFPFCGAQESLQHCPLYYRQQSTLEAGND